MTRAELKAHAQRKSRRSSAAARFQVCANVFARSRIHFDASCDVPMTALSIDRADAQRTGHDAVRDDVGGGLLLPAAAPQFIVH